MPRIASMLSYPPPPWHTEGYAVFRSYRVPSRAIDVPAGLSIRSVAGYSLGLFAFVRYLPPSPLSYSELIWMPTLVEAKGRIGFYVARMHVDDERSLQAGRQVWGLPKTMARFDEEGEDLRVETADGSRFALRIGGRGPALPARSSMATLQWRDGAPLRFKATTRGKTRIGKLDVDDFEINEPGWESFRHARPMPAPAVSLETFKTIMQAPEPL